MLYNAHSIVYMYLLHLISPFFTGLHSYLSDFSYPVSLSAHSTLANSRYTDENSLKILGSLVLLPPCLFRRSDEYVAQVALIVLI